MCLLLFVVVNADEKQFICVLDHLIRILLTLDLADSSIRILIVFEFQHNGGRIDILPWDEYNICKALTRG